MSDVIAKQIQGAMSSTLTAINQTFSPSGTRCFLLKRAGDTSKFTAIIELTSGFWAKWSDYRQQMRFRFASSADMTEYFAQATHIGHGVPDTHSKMFVFEIDPEARDFTSPDGSSPFWSIFADKIRNERYTIPTPTP